MATKAGYVAFMDPRVNQKLRDILDYWGRFLQSPDSTYVLNRSKEGWLGDEALKSSSVAGAGAAWSAGSMRRRIMSFLSNQF